MKPSPEILLKTIIFFSHPDYNCRLRNSTASASIRKFAGYTAGRDLRPAPKTSFTFKIIIPHRLIPVKVL